jgi:hypothetical protein
MDRIVIDNLLSVFSRDPTPLMVGDEDVCRCKITGRESCMERDELFKSIWLLS